MSCSWLLLWMLTDQSCRYKVTKKTKRIPGKAGLRYYKNVGLGFKTPKEAIEGNDLVLEWEAKPLRNLAPGAAKEGIRGNPRRSLTTLIAHKFNIRFPGYFNW